MAPKLCSGFLGLMGVIAALSCIGPDFRPFYSGLLVDALPLPHRPFLNPTFSRRRTSTNIACDLRGGGENKQQTYINLLKEDNLRLEQKIRVYQERVERLREAQNVAHEATLAFRSQGGARKELQEYKKLTKNLQKQVASLEASLKQMADLKQQVEELFQAELEKVKQLEEKIAAAKLESKERQKEFQAELQELRKQMDDRAAEQLKSLRAKLEAQAQQALNEAVKHAQSDAAKLYQADLKREIQQLQREHQTALQALKSDYERSMAEMKVKHDEELEDERQRRKKLLKSLSTREKQIALENLQLEQAKRAAAKKAKQQKQPTETVRTPIK